jgi:hypothetical protein
LLEEQDGREKEKQKARRETVGVGKVWRRRRTDKTELAGSHSGDTESGSYPTPAIMRSFVVFLGPPKLMSVQCVEFGSVRFLPRPFAFAVHTRSAIGLIH